MLRIILLLLTVTHINDSARILAIVPSASFSHQVVFRPIWKELSKRGHEVVLLTTDPMKDKEYPNLKQIDWSGAYVWSKKFSETIQTSRTPLGFIFALFDMITEVNRYELGHPEVQAIIHNKSEHFDLVMTEILMPTMAAFKHRFNCPLIGLTSIDAPLEVHNALGNPTHHVLYPIPILPYDDKLSFFERLISVGFTKFFEIYALVFYGGENDIIEKYFGEKYPDINTLRDDLEMVFVNTNPVMQVVRPVSPATITIGGAIHIEEKKELPEPIKSFLDDATEGFIYFSLGSNVKSKDLENKETFFNAFKELPYRVLWKFEDKELPGKPDNVMIVNWAPQHDILRHPNIKLFITQGGLQSFEEAMVIKVPLIGIPFFADQESNTKKIADKGLGLKLDHKTLTTEELKAAALEVIKNPTYKAKVTELSKLITDEPMNGLEKAIWWTEYVIRHKGAQHLKGPGKDMPMYQYLYLDIIGFVILTVSIFISIVYYIFKGLILLVCKLLCKKKKIKVQ